MPSPSTTFYEEQFRGCIMQKMLEGKAMNLKAFLQQLIDENKKDYTAINAAYLKVRKELLG